MLLVNQLAGFGVGSSGAYSIKNAASFNGSTGYMHWTPASAGNQKTWTWVGWVKNIGATQCLFSAGPSAGNNLTIWRNGTNITLYVNGSGVRITSSPTIGSPYFHLAVKFDSTQASANDRARIYIDGAEATYGTNTTIALNFDSPANAATEHRLGLQSASIGLLYFGGILADTYFLDGIAADCTLGGAFLNADGSPKNYTGSFGTNGSKLDFADSGDLGNDVSGNNNDWTVVGGVTQSTDVPT